MKGLFILFGILIISNISALKLSDVMNLRKQLKNKEAGMKLPEGRKLAKVPAAPEIKSGVKEEKPIAAPTLEVKKDDGKDARQLKTHKVNSRKNFKANMKSHTKTFKVTMKSARKNAEKKKSHVKKFSAKKTHKKHHVSVKVKKHKKKHMKHKKGKKRVHKSKAKKHVAKKHKKHVAKKHKKHMKMHRGKKSRHLETALPPQPATSKAPERKLTDLPSQNEFYDDIVSHYYPTI